MEIPILPESDWPSLHPKVDKNKVRATKIKSNFK